ncbi:MAG: fimbrillin family protein [Bacteroidaceae bacterium]
MKTNSMKWAALLFAGALAGCNNSNEPAVDDNAPMMVTLGANTKVTTKAAIDGTTIPANLDFSVWGMAKNATTWADYATATDRRSLFAGGGVTARVAAGKFNFTTPTYYPLENAYNYTFYGVAPATTATLDGEKLNVSYTVNGTQDVLWGYSAADDAAKEQKGFNAKYLRLEDGSTGDKPSIEFNHMLTRFTFIVKLGGDAPTNPTNLKVDRIQLNGVKNTFTFTMADKDVTTYTGVPAVTLTGDAADLPLVNDNGDVITTAAFVAEQVVGDMMIPTDGTLTEVPLTTILSSDNTATTEPLQYNAVIKTVDGSAFLPGKKYAVTMTVYPEREVEVEATLLEWEDGVEIEDLPEIN